MMRIATGVAGLVMIMMLSTAAAQEETQAPDVNDEAPDFELKDVNGVAHRLSDLRGKNVILEFIRSGGW